MRGELKSRARTNKRSAKNPPAQLSEGMEMEQLYLSRRYGKIWELGFAEGCEITLPRARGQAIKPRGTRDYQGR